jgi:hypothetical protein
LDPTAFSVLLGACSETLKKLDINLTDSECMIPVLATVCTHLHIFLDYSIYYYQSQHHGVVPVFSPLPTNLQQLTIRIAIEFVFGPNHSPIPDLCQSWLPPAAGLIHQFIPHHPQHLVLEIKFGNAANLTNIDISPLAVLEAASVSIPRIDLYAFAWNPIAVPRSPAIPITNVRLMSVLKSQCPGVVKLINEGKIAVHSQKTVP